MQQTPNAATAIAMRRPIPSTVRRSTSRTAQARAPTPVAAIRKPSVCAPPPSVRPASTGVSTVYGALITPMAARKTSRLRMGVDRTR